MFNIPCIFRAQLACQSTLDSRQLFRHGHLSSNVNLRAQLVTLCGAYFDTEARGGVVGIVDEDALATHTPLRPFCLLLPLKRLSRKLFAVILGKKYLGHCLSYSDH